jgi:hypothetical protein
MITEFELARVTPEPHRFPFRDFSSTSRTFMAIAKDALVLGVVWAVAELCTMLSLRSIGALNNLDHAFVPELVWILPISYILFLLVTGIGAAVINWNYVRLFNGTVLRPWMPVSLGMACYSGVTLLFSGRIALISRLILALGLTVGINMVERQDCAATIMQKG